MITLFRPGEFNIYNAHINSSCNRSEQGETISLIRENDTELSYCFIEAQIFLSRRPIYYVYIIVYPIVVVSLLSLLVFRLTPGSGERVCFRFCNKLEILLTSFQITLCITLMLVYQFLLMSVGAQMPQSADTVPLLAIYLSLEMILASLSLAMSILVINLHEKGSGKQVRTL